MCALVCALRFWRCSSRFGEKRASASQQTFLCVFARQMRRKRLLCRARHNRLLLSLSRLIAAAPPPPPRRLARWRRNILTTSVGQVEGDAQADAQSSARFGSFLAVGRARYWPADLPVLRPRNSWRGKLAHLVALSLISRVRRRQSVGGARKIIRRPPSWPRAGGSIKLTRRRRRANRSDSIAARPILAPPPHPANRSRFARNSPRQNDNLHRLGRRRRRLFQIARCGNEPKCRPTAEGTWYKRARAGEVATRTTLIDRSGRRNRQ